MVLGVKQGQYFQGRLNVSRLVADQATIKIQGLGNDILIENFKNQNRALNGDIVCVEILPEDQWVQNYKSTDQANALLDDAQEVEKVVSDNEDEQENINILDRINNESQKQVTAKVKGVLKSLNKTYGGSLISREDMVPKTKEKFDQFTSHFNIVDKYKESQFLVFVPYNIQMPQALLRAQNPEALKNKRLIVRYQKWDSVSPFPQAQFVKIVGEEGKIGTETNMILHEFNVDTRPFS